jgi:hypothetical protein
MVYYSSIVAIKLRKYPEDEPVPALIALTVQTLLVYTASLNHLKIL